MQRNYMGLKIPSCICRWGKSWTRSVFLGCAVVKNPPTNAGDKGDISSIPRSGRSLGGGNCNPVQYSCLENSKDRVAWQATVHRITTSWTHLSTHACMHAWTTGYKTKAQLPLLKSYEQKKKKKCWEHKAENCT